MARQISIASLETKIEKAEAAVIRTKAAYDNATRELKELLDKRDALRRDEIVNAVLNSKKSYAEIIQFLSEDCSEVDE